MKRILVHLIRGEAQSAHEAITKDLAERFDTFPLHDRIAPHLTLKRWFELSDEGMKGLYTVLDDFADLHTQTAYRLKGFGHFGEDVIYVDVVPSKETSSAVRELMAVLHGIEGMTFDEYDNEEDDLHATVVMGALGPFDFDEVWNYVTSIKQPDFVMRFDNIALLKRTEERWVLERVWELK